MPTYVVTIKANLCENVCQLMPREGRTLWALKLKCEACGDTTPNFVEVDSTDQVEVNGGFTNASYKCKGCKGLMSATVVTAEASLRKLFNSTDLPSKASPEQGVPVLAVELRGCAPEEFGLDDAWSIVCGSLDEDGTPTGGVIEDVDLCDEVSDYDEKTGAAVSLGELTVTFVRK